MSEQNEDMSEQNNFDDVGDSSKAHDGESILTVDGNTSAAETKSSDNINMAIIDSMALNVNKFCNPNTTFKPVILELMINNLGSWVPQRFSSTVDKAVYILCLLCLALICTYQISKITEDWTNFKNYFTSFVCVARVLWLRNQYYPIWDNKCIQNTQKDKKFSYSLELLSQHKFHGPKPFNCQISID